MKIDFRKELKHLYNPPRTRVEIVDVPQMNFLMIDGSGDPNTAQEYKDSVEALYAVSYTLKFMVKKAKGVDYGVLPLEGLWWTGDDDTFSLENKDLWNWTSLMMQPEHVSKASVHKALEHVEKKKNPPALAKARFEPFLEGLCAQTLHIGPYAAEGPTIDRLHQFITGEGYELQGKHHEIYLSDPRRSAPEKLRTIIRQPIK